MKGGVTGNARRHLPENRTQQNIRQSENATSSRFEGNHPLIRSDRVERYEQQFTQRGNGVKVPIKPVKPITPPKPETGEIVKPWKPVEPGTGEPVKPVTPIKPLYVPGEK